MKVAVVGGTGRWGRNIVRTLESLPETTVLWTAGSRDEWEKRLTDPDLRPDAVAIASPSSLHAEHSLAVLSAGLPVFVEKPVALSVADAERVRDEAARRRLVVIVDHIHLFNPAWRALKVLVAARGGATTVQSAAGNAGPFRPDVSPLWDWGAHDVALALDLFGGAPFAIHGAPDGEGNDRMELTFAGGGTWSACVGSRFAERMRLVRVAAGIGEVIWDDLKSPKLVSPDGPVAVVGDSPLTVALREFLAAVAGGPRPTSDATFGTEVIRILAKCGPARPAGVTA